MLAVESYAITTLAITAAYVYTGRKYSLPTLSLAMFFPSMFAPWFNEDPDRWKQILGVGQATLALTNAIMGGLIIIVVLAAVSAINYSTSWGKEVSDRSKSESKMSGDLFTDFIRAAGEEIGWRCYLLPELMKKYSPFNALLISGVVWGLFHVPVIYVMTKRYSVSDAGKTILFQFLQCILSAFPYGWVAIQSGFSMWASTIMHLTWNRINPVIFGSIYTQRPGKMVGKLWLINGEGAAGCIALFPCAVLIYMTL